jgi:DNA (cytosine-5)-methyltransferase 1
MTMRFGSLFSGIGGFDLGFERAGMIPAWQCEIDAAARGVLTRQFPDVSIMEDVRNVRSDNCAAVDLVCGGFPCQDLSVAGKRAGLAGERSGLWFEFRRVLDVLRPQWVVIENVPGLLSSNAGRDFAVLLRGLVELRYGVAWRILDAQYFGVAQRRRRVFIVGSLGDGRAAQVLFESEGVSGHPPARRKAGQGIANTLRGGTAGGSSYGKPSGTDRGTFVSAPLAAHHSRDDLDHGAYIAYGGNNTSGALKVATACNAHGGSGRMDFESETFVTYNVFGGNKRRDRPEGGFYVNETEQSKTLDGSGLSAEMAQGGTIIAATQYGIRRLTPTECERLQGFPDGWTAGQSDSARYRQLGNAVAVPCAKWIGNRIMELAR